MSSIYDALQKIQGDKGSWTTPPGNEGPPVPRKRTGLIVIIAVIMSSIVTAGVFFSIKSFGVKKQEVVLDRKTPVQAPNRQGPEKNGYPAGVQPVPAAQAFAQTPPDPGRPATLPDNLDDYMRLGEQFFSSRDYDKALSTYMEALHFFRKDARLLNNIGSVYLAKGQNAKAIHYFMEAQDESKNYVEPVYNLACAYALQGDKAKAMKNLKLAIGMDHEVKTWAASDPDLLELKGYGQFDRIIRAK